jgi:hypothetical protein
MAKSLTFLRLQSGRERLEEEIGEEAMRERELTEGVRWSNWGGGGGGVGLNKI